MVGAEGVCASGGILNKVGTYPLAICAQAINKPFYVVAESYKFIRMYPLNQNDVPTSTQQHESSKSDLRTDKLDYTPPAYITLILTDLGPLTTAAISDELMKIYLWIMNYNWFTSREHEGRLFSISTFADIIFSYRWCRQLDGLFPQPNPKFSITCCICQLRTWYRLYSLSMSWEKFDELG